jgi:hypothetical protein
MLQQAIAVLLSLSLAEWVSILSALLAIASLAISRTTLRRQQAMQTETFRRQRDDMLIAWAKDAIAAVADSQQLCRDTKNGLIAGLDERRRASDLRTGLSVLLDTGRLFFPNARPADGTNGDDEGAVTSEAAYSGAEHDAIASLRAVYRIVSDIGRDEDPEPATTVQAIVAARRRFVSEVFRSIDPRRRDAAFAALTETVSRRRRT